jgi:hypothetical protein
LISFSSQDIHEEEEEEGRRGLKIAAGRGGLGIEGGAS